MAEIRVVEHGMDDLLRKLNAAPGLIDREAQSLMRISLDFIEQQVLGRTPVNTGNLRDSISTSMRGRSFSELHGEVTTPIVYGLPVELGRAPGKMPPVDAIEYWVIRKGIADPEEARSVAFLIARAIGRRGTKGAFMFENAFEASKGLVLDLWRGLPDRVVRAMST